MASLKDVKIKIGGVAKTKQITKAMYMVASARLRGAQSRIERFRPYAEKFQEILGDLAGKTGETDHPLLAPRAEVKTTGIVLITSDRGLCGGYNVNLIAAALRLAADRRAQGKETLFYCFGRKGRDAVRKLGFPLALEEIGQMNALDFSLANKAGLRLMEDYLGGVLDEVILIYGAFISMARQQPAALPLLPIVPAEASGGEERKIRQGYSYEPQEAALLAEMLPRFIKAQIYRGLLDTSAGEHAARMTAMDNATRNCDELVADLTLLYNKTRQAAITTELIDIVGGVEALKG
ncbi:MAG: F0F1 ATP synthase subunit gamma [Desulfovibrio sp.]|jgi:F-type H+-transporting ATPase subunit gamma|nr:F0F1 ATP synthase subunit gamma [Desulfovibrio sp.]